MPPRNVTDEDREDPALTTRRIGPGDPACGFRSGKHALDDYFARHALPNDQAGIGRAYVLEATADETAAASQRYSGSIR